MMLAKQYPLVGVGLPLGSKELIMAIDLLNLINRPGVAAGYDPSFAGLEEEQRAATAASRVS